MPGSGTNEIGGKQDDVGTVSLALAGTSGAPGAPGTPGERLEVPLLPLIGSVILPMSVHPLSLQGEQAAQLIEAAQHSGG